MGEITRNSRKKKAWLKHRKDDRGTAVSLLFANHCVYFCLRGQAANRGTSQHQPLHPLFLTISTIASFAFTISTIASFAFTHTCQPLLSLPHLSHGIFSRRLIKVKIASVFIKAVFG